MDNRNKKYLQWTMRIILVITVAAICLFGLFKRTDSVILKADGYTVSSNNVVSDMTFVLIQKDNERVNEIETVKSLLNQNDVGYYCIKYDSGKEENLGAAAEYIVENKKSEKTILLSHFKDYIEYFGEENLDGVIVCSPQHVSDTELPLLLISGSTDKAASPQNVTAIFNEKTGSVINATGFGVNAQKDNVTMRIVPKVFGTLSHLPKEYIANLSQWVYNSFGTEFKYMEFDSVKTLVLLLMVISLCFVYALHDWRNHTDENTTVYRLVNIKSDGYMKYFGVRVLLFFAGLPICLIFVGIIWFVPFLNLTSGNVLSAYLFSAGIISLVLYAKGKMPGIVGRVSSRDLIASSSAQIFKTILMFIPLLIPMLSLVILGIAEVEFRMDYLWEFIFCFAMTFTGFYSYNLENLILSETRKGTLAKILSGIMPFLPMIAISLAGIPFGYTTWLYTSIIQIIGIFTVTIVGSSACRINNHIVFASFLQSVVCSAFLNFIRLV